MIRVAVAAGAALLAAAFAAILPAGQQQAAGLATVFDSTGDTIVARVSGVVPAAALRRLVPEMKIAPGIDDTTRFTETYEFEVDRRGYIWVFDHPSKSILLFDSAGRKVRRIGRSGGGPGEFRDNGGMVVLTDGRLAQWDPSNARISFFSPAGEFLTSWPLPGGFGSTNNLVSDASGALYTRRPRYGRGQSGGGGRRTDVGVLIRYGARGALGDTLVPPAFDVQTSLLGAQGSGQTVAISGPNTPRSLWTWHPDGYFVAGNGTNHSIILGRTRARPIRIERSAPAVPISEQERRTAEAAVTVFMRQTDPTWVWRGPRLPDRKPALLDLFVARDGRIWASVPAPSRRIVGGDVTAPSSAGSLAGQRFQQFRSPEIWEVYSVAGTFLGRVPFPDGTQLIQADGDRVWIIERDGDDLPAVVRLRIDPLLREIPTLRQR